jgi:hypothetical protein
MLKKLQHLGLLTTLVVFSGSLLPSPTLAAEKWVRVKTDSEKTSWYVDKGSIEFANQKRTFWLYAVNDKPSQFREHVYYSAGIYVSVNCRNKRLKPHFLRLMDQQNQALGDYEWSGREVTVFNAGVKASANFVCSQR